MSEAKQTDAVQEFFGEDAGRYDDRHYGARYRTFISDRHQLVTRVFKDLGLPGGANVLDIACGPGRFLHEAASSGAVAVGIDASREMLRTSHKRLGSRATLVLGSGLTLPFASATFDVINSSGFIEYLPDPMPMLREAFRV